MGRIKGRGCSPYLVRANAHNGTLFAPLLLWEGGAMPRKAIEIPDHIEYLSILDEHGRVDTTLMPDLAEEQLRHVHRIMLLSRRFDERLLSLQRQGRIGTFAPNKGQEAAQIGAVAPLQQEDWVVPSFREIAAAIYRGT